MHFKFMYKCNTQECGEAVTSHIKQHFKNKPCVRL